MAETDSEAIFLLDLYFVQDVVQVNTCSAGSALAASRRSSLKRGSRAVFVS